jgi:hypothetical protein
MIFVVVQTLLLYGKFFSSLLTSLVNFSIKASACFALGPFCYLGTVRDEGSGSGLAAIVFLGNEQSRVFSSWERVWLDRFQSGKTFYFTVWKLDGRQSLYCFHTGVR